MMNAATNEAFRYTSARERRERMLQFISDQGYCTISELSAVFGVSEMTIRRDVLKLVDRGKARSFRGGVGSLPPQEMIGSDYSFRSVANAKAKNAIALRAIELVVPQSVIAIDAGTTAARLAQVLPDNLDLKAVTNSYPAVASLVANTGVELICLGGTFHRDSLSFESTRTLSNYQIGTFFLAASGVSARGAFCANSFDAITKRELIEVSERVVLLADSSKFAASAMVKICDWEVIDRLIIDDGVTDEQRRILEQQGVDLDVVETAEEQPTGTV